MSPAQARLGILLALAVFVASAPAQATVIATDPSVTDSIPGIAGFETTGALMGGMSVQVLFDSGFSETVSWVAGGGNFGQASGSDWSLSVDGDTFFARWNFANDTGAGLVGLIIQGAPGLTVFDRTFGGAFGTPGSARGRDFVETPIVPGTATYSQQVAVGMNLPVGDLWHTLSIRFEQGLFGDFFFLQDTDNDIRRPPPTVPEPSTLALLGAALALTGLWRRRRG